MASSVVCSRLKKNWLNSFNKMVIEEMSWQFDGYDGFPTFTPLVPAALPHSSWLMASLTFCIVGFIVSWCCSYLCSSCLSCLLLSALTCTCDVCCEDFLVPVDGCRVFDSTDIAHDVSNVFVLFVFDHAFRFLDNLARVLFCLSVFFWCCVVFLYEPSQFSVVLIVQNCVFFIILP